MLALIFRSTKSALDRSFARSFSVSAVVETKLKTHKGTAKRWKAVSNGSFKRGQAGKQHLNTGYASWQLSKLGRSVYSSATQTRTLKRLLPYAS